MPAERKSITHKLVVGPYKGFLIVGLYDDGTPGEIFLDISKEGSTISGFADCFAISVSFALQYGVPLEALVEKFKGVRFEPRGYTKHPVIKEADSIVDYVFRWLEWKFSKQETAEPQVEASQEAS